MIKLDVFVLPGCSRCSAGLEALKAVALSFGPNAVGWEERNLLENIDYAVELGVLSAPAMAIDGQLVFASVPNPQQLRDELTRRVRA